MLGSSEQMTSCMHNLGNMQALKHDMAHLKKPVKVIFHLKIERKKDFFKKIFIIMGLDVLNCPKINVTIKS